MLPFKIQYISNNKFVNEKQGIGWSGDLEEVLETPQHCIIFLPKRQKNDDEGLFLDKILACIIFKKVIKPYQVNR